MFSLDNEIIESKLFIALKSTQYVAFVIKSNVLICMSPQMAGYHCYLVCASDTHPPITLPHKTAVLVGRSPATLIQDIKVSRHQGNKESELHIKDRIDCINETVATVPYPRV